MIDWKSIFIYDLSAPSCLLWRSDRKSGRNYKCIHVHKNSPAGNLVFDSFGSPLYIDVRLGNRTYKAGRIVWEYFNGPVPDGMVIDHLDGNAHNNCLENLACKTQAKNSRNRKLPKTNTSGKIGIHWISSKTDRRAVARWVDLSGKRKSKSFSVNTYGEGPALKMAVEFRDKKIEELNELGAEYTERHGQK